MAVHYFHCTDGKNLILDQTGRRTHSRRELGAVASLIADEVMKTIPGPVDWSRWLVSIQNRKGSMVAVIPFPADGSIGVQPIND